MHYFVTTVDVYCDDFEPEYTRKFFRSKEAMEAYLVTLEDDEIHSYGPWPKVLDEIPFWVPGVMPGDQIPHSVLPHTKCGLRSTAL